MALSNRDKDVSEQKQSYTVTKSGSLGGTTLSIFTTAATCQIMVVPYPAELKALSVSAQGCSGALNGQVKIHRFIPGAGVTYITGIGASLTIPEFGTSGSLSASLVASGSTILNLLSGDILFFHAGVANTAAESVTFGITLKALQDFKADFGSST